MLIRTELVIGQARDEAQVASILRQTITGKAGFIASSKNKTWKQTKVLSESDVYSVSPPELAQPMATRSSTHKG